MPRDDEFLLHVENIVGCLKQIGQNGRIPTGEQRNAPDFVLQLHIYVLRTCFPKILVRAGYHCQHLRNREGDVSKKEGGRAEKEGSGSKGEGAGSNGEGSGLKREGSGSTKGGHGSKNGGGGSKKGGGGSKGEGVGSRVDYSGLFRPTSRWNSAHEEAAASYASGVRETYSSTLAELLHQTGKGLQVDPTLLEKTDRPNFDDSFSEFTDRLQAYKPNDYELCISKHCSKVWGMTELPVQEGFYLTDAGRRAYHEMLTTCFANTLLGLRLISKLGSAVSGSVKNDSEIYDILQFAAGSIRNLFYLAYYSPLLGIHLKWLLELSSPTASQQPTSDFNQGLIHGQRVETTICQQPVQPAAIRGSQIRKSKKRDADQLDALEESSFHSDGGKMFKALDEILDSDIVPNRDELFPIRDYAVTSILRWLRLITLHTCSIESLALTDTCNKLKSLDVKLLQTTLPQGDTDMEPLDACLERLIPDLKDREAFSDTVRTLSKNHTVEFRGTWHCEALLLSLYLLSLDGKDRDGVPCKLRWDANTLFPHIVAVSKECCPVCTTLFQAVSEQQHWEATAVIGSHQTYSACALPPWLPKRFCDKVTEILEDQLRLSIDERLEVSRRQRRFSRGSVSPIFHGTLTASAIDSLSAGHTKIEDLPGAKRLKQRE